MGKFLLSSLLLCSTAMAICEESLLQDKWTLTPFINSQYNAVKSVVGKGAMKINILSDTDRKTHPEMKRIYSFSQKLPECDKNGVLKLTFEAKQTANRQFYLLVIVGSSPGNCPPGTHSAVQLTNDWKEYSVNLPLPGIKDNSVFEFIWEGVMQKGDSIELRNIVLTEDESKSSAQNYILNPVNLVLENSAANQTFSGTLLPLRSQKAGKYSIDLYDEFDETTSIKNIAGDIIHPKTDWSIDVKDLEAGKYTLVLNITGADGKKFTPIKQNIWKSDLKTSGSYVKAHTVYRNGQPFIPVSIYHAGIWNMERINQIRQKIGEPLLNYDEMFKDIADRGFNSIHFVTKPDGSDINDYVKYIDKYNLLVIPEFRNPEKANFTMPKNLLGWYGKDEASSGEAHQIGRKLYADLKNIEPQSIVFAANYTQEITKVTQQSGAIFDVLLFDHYVIRSKDTNFSVLSKELKKLSKDIEAMPGMVLGYVPQTFIYNGPEPTVAQMRLQVYIAIINKVKSFAYYAYCEDYDLRVPFTSRKDQFPEIPDGMSKNSKRQHWFIADSLMWDKIADLNKEINDLSDFILNDGEKIKVICNDDAIDFAAKNVNGKKYLIMVNLTAQNHSANVKFAQARNWVGKFNPDLKLEAKRGANLIDFAPYEVKVFTAE